MEAFQSRGRHYVLGKATRDIKDYVPVPPDLGSNLQNFLGVNYKMPLKRRSRTNIRTRRRRKIFRKRKPRAVQPYSIVRSFKTVAKTAFNPGAAGCDTQQLKLNSASDPTGTIGTGQPLGYDQYTALYNRYCVVGWKVNVKCVSTDNSNAIAIGFTPKVQSTALTSYQHYMECPGTVARHMTPDIDKVEFGAKGSVKKWLLPRGGKMLSDDLCTALYNADPSKLLHGHLWMQAIDDAADPVIVHAIVTITQIVVFYDPIVPSRS